MAYFTPYIDPAGLHVPTYQDILDDLIAQARSIFGQDIYLGNDSADYQLLSIMALKISDTMEAVQLAYNSRGPVTAVGSALDGVVKLNGLARKSASYSTCIVTLTGAMGTIITGGIVADVNGVKWTLPSPIGIGGSGTLSVVATCQTIGAVTALPGTITTIVTPTAGWTAVTNAAAAVAGQPVETDAQLRARQSISAALPSSTLLAGTIAGVAALEGVSRWNVIENPTGSVDSYGTPAHSITCVVEGSTDEAVAQTIYNNKGIGCYTNGTTSVVVNDPTYGLPSTIRFYRPSYVAIDVTLSIHQLSGYVSTTTDAIKAAVAAYLNSLQIGEELTISGLYGAALSVMPDLSRPLFSIRGLTAGLHGGAQATDDITVDFFEVTTGDVADITVNMV